MRKFMFDVGGVLALWAILLVLENVFIGTRYAEEFSGTWEMAHARRFLGPIALAAAVPLAVIAVTLGHFANRPRSLAAVFAIFGAFVAVGVSNGRHFESYVLRVPLVVVIAFAVSLAGLFGARLANALGPTKLAALGVAMALAGWTADAFVLPRLYPAFHFALFAISLGGAALIWPAFGGARLHAVVGLLGLGLGVFSLAWSQHAARQVVGDDNLRRVLLEHAPLLGRAVVVGSRLSPPPPLEEGAPDTLLSPSVSTHALDWRGRDIVLVTIDALRADHVGAYGYARKTTPNIDALAAGGVRFDRAYCPTPHTSYSVTSMMTGKYMRPLLAMGADDHPETWAMHLRRYGYRTGAFYPPAVFFIDEHRFKDLEESGLGFEYRKVEFASPELKTKQVERYLERAPRDKPLFLWVHLFEPHEPYEMHEDHRFAGDERSDAYDSEIATADAVVGSVVNLVNKRSPGAVFIVTADHGEELGDHGGRYHGTTVYEEQVRVPLVVSGPGIGPRVIAEPVQTVDLLPTTLAALDVPMPARLRGRDLGARIADGSGDEGLAFAETDDWTLLARGADRLICARKIGACTLFDIANDPAEKHGVTDRPARVDELRKLTAAVERENGRVEASGTPDALRRGLQGDQDAAEEVATLLDDVRPDIRQKAARALFRLRPSGEPFQLRRAASKDEDDGVRTWAGLALARRDASAAVPSIEAGSPDVRTAAALVLAERGDGRGESVLVARWQEAFGPDAKAPGELDEARELLAALATIKAKSAVLPLARSLASVTLRPYVVDALGEIGDPRAKGALLATFAAERYVNVRPKEAAALLALGAREELRAPLMRFAGVPEPMAKAIVFARAAKLLVTSSWDDGAPASVVLPVPAGSPELRLLVVAANDPSPKVEGRTLTGVRLDDEVWSFEVGVRPVGTPPAVTLEAPGIRAAWLVPHAAEIAPPPPVAWDAGPDPDLP